MNLAAFETVHVSWSAIAHVSCQLCNSVDYLKLKFLLLSITRLMVLTPSFPRNCIDAFGADPYLFWKIGFKESWRGHFSRDSFSLLFLFLRTLRVCFLQIVPTRAAASNFALWKGTKKGQTPLREVVNNCIRNETIILHNHLVVSQQLVYGESIGI